MKIYLNPEDRNTALADIDFAELPVSSTADAYVTVADELADKVEDVVFDNPDTLSLVPWDMAEDQEARELLGL